MTGDHQSSRQIKALIFDDSQGPGLLFTHAALLSTSGCGWMSLPMTVSPQNRAQFEIMGAAGLRSDMITGNYIKNRDTLDQAHEWLKEQDSIKERRESVRFWSMILLTAAAAIAACIAAWPVVKG
jgi:hypothetical protein